MVRATMSLLARHLTLAIATIAAVPAWAQAPETTTTSTASVQPTQPALTEPVPAPVEPTQPPPATEPAPAATEPALVPPPANTTTETTVTATVTEAPKSPPASPYVPPFQLRPAQPVTVLRFDSAVAFFESGVDASPTYASFVTAAYKFSPNFGAFARMGMVDGSLPTQERRGLAISNPAIGVVAANKPTENTRFAAYLTFALPLGSGGGDKPDVLAKSARQAAISARASMDNVMFGVNDFGIAPGIDFAYVKGGMTLQAEVTFIGAFRARGEADQVDSSKLNLTSGVFFGFFMADWISFGSEVHYQYWLKPPAAIDNSPNKSALRGQGSVAVGPRLHIKTGDAWVRPGFAYMVGFDDPMAALDYSILFFDVPVTF